jgi:S1-C subfamily serine protease
MDEQQRRRIRQVALTGALAPGLLLGVAGAVGFGDLSGVFGPTHAAAQTTLEEQTCNAFSAPTTAPAVMSVADVAAKVNPAVVTIVNLQQLSSQDLNGISGIPGFPEFPMLPGIDELPGIQGIPGHDQPSHANGSDDADQDQDQDQNQDQNQDRDQDDDDITEAPFGSGSGFIVDDAGHVVTNAHVVDGATDLTAVLADGTEVPAKVAGSDPLLDVAVLQLDLPAGTSVPGTVAFGDSSQLRPGDEVVAIGNALGEFPNTVSDGTVNGVHRAFPGAYGLSAMIQHDAEIWHGNSGGPLLNLEGEVVGINTAGIGSGMMGVDTGSASMGFAIESNIACNAAADLLDDGKIVWPYLGIQGEAGADGQTVVDIVPDGPSADAGLEVGDIITAFGGQTIDRQHTLLDLLFGHKPGDTVDLTVDRDGDAQTVQVTLGERPDMTQ